MLKDFNSPSSLVRRKKRAVNSLKRQYSPVVEPLNLSDKNHQKMIFEFIEKSMPDEKVIEEEFLSITRFVKGGGYRDSDHLIIGAFIDSKLVGFCFTEILKDQFANFHFWKADSKTYKHIYSFLLQENAKLLINKHDTKLLNIEQDLGIKNLRKWKEGFGSQFLLRKYIIVPN